MLDAVVYVLALAPTKALRFAFHISLPILRRSRSVRFSLLFLAGDGLRLALAGARIGVRALAADGEALPVAKAAVGREVHKPLDVHRHLTAKVALHLVVGVDRLADLEDFLVGQILHPALRSEEHTSELQSLMRISY